MMKARQAQADLLRVQREKEALAAENERLRQTFTTSEAAKPAPVRAVFLIRIVRESMATKRCLPFF